jgi:hypothetical protein
VTDTFAFALERTGARGAALVGGALAALTGVRGPRRDVQSGP